MTKAIRVMSDLLFLPLLVTAQNTKDPPQPANEPKPSTQMFIWSEKRDVFKWLQENKSSLDRGDGCTLYVFYSTSAVFSIASFVAVPEEEEDITRIIHDSATESGLDIRVGVHYAPQFLSPPGKRELEIALAFEGSPGDVFSEVNGAQARTIRDRNWKFLSVQKRINVGDLQYTFSLQCVNGKFFLDFLRRPAKHKSRPNHRSSVGQAPWQFGRGDSLTTRWAGGGPGLTPPESRHAQRDPMIPPSVLEVLLRSGSGKIGEIGHLQSCCSKIGQKFRGDPLVRGFRKTEACGHTPDDQNRGRGDS